MGLLNLLVQAREAYATGYRSTVVTPLVWLAAILLPGLALLVYHKASTWVLVVVVVLLALDVVAFFAAFAYFALRDPDALRSEGFKLSKLAMERARIGDSDAGLSTKAELTQQPTVAQARVSEDAP